MRENKFRGRCRETGDWMYGSYVKTAVGMHYILPQNLIANVIPQTVVDEKTIGQYVGLRAKFNLEIFDGDITELKIDGEVRRFVVRLKTVVREVVSHPSFDDDTAKVAITGVIFEWNGFELFPCVDENRKSDVEDMVIIGNVHDNPELLEVAE
ncbi:YopX family protein [Sporosarcina sp. FSL K6-3457]|uniref:YopX family protein n=1 Tax=Sporosarcina sp. FSL K6-3457 TaxID=2978204 RepID=UPI0030F9C23D